MTTKEICKNCGHEKNFHKLVRNIHGKIQLECSGLPHGEDPESISWCHCKKFSPEDSDLKKGLLFNTQENKHYDKPAETKETIQGNFDKVFEDILLTYSRNFKDKGDSWKYISIEDLNSKFDEELKEFQEASGMRNTYQELIDMILVALMLARRLK